MSLSSYEITQSLQQTDGSIALDELRNLNATSWFFTIPSIRYKLFKETGDFKLVADPQLRVAEGQAASLLIGQEVPIVITQFSPTQFVGAQIVPIRTTQYRDVGISMNIGARVHHNAEVSLSVDFEISSISGQVGIENLPIFITRQVSSNTRLRDGETAILAGLLRDDERTGTVGVPGLSDIPLIGKLFSSTRTEVEQVDVILTITPHILRMPQLNQADVDLVYLGREIDLGEGSLVRGGVSDPIPLEEQVTIEPIGPEEPAPPVPALVLTPPPGPVTVGDTFTVELRLENVEDLTSAGAGLSFDSKLLEYVEGAEAGFFSSDGAQTAFEMRRAAPSGVGVAVTRLGNATGVSGSGVVARMTFRALAPGDATISFNTVALRRTSGQPLPVDFKPARVRVVQ